MAAVESNLLQLQSNISLNASSDIERTEPSQAKDQPKFHRKEAYETMVKEDKEASLAESKGDYKLVNEIIIKFISCATDLVRNWRETLKNKFSVDLLMLCIERVVQILFQDEYRQPESKRITVLLDQKSLDDIDFLLSLIKVEDNLASSTLYGEWHKINKFSNCLTLLLRSLYRHFKYKSESFKSKAQADFIE